MSERICIISGYFGSGKTEFAINYALQQSKTKGKVAICDLDIINPYFRTREKEKLLYDHNIDLIAGNLSGANADIPAVSARIKSGLRPLYDKTILDLGGSSSGAIILKQFQPYIEKSSYDMWLVVNRNRPETDSLNKILKLKSEIESACGLTFNGIINNTHMLKETGLQDVIYGSELCIELSRKTGIPTVLHAIKEDVTIDEKIFKDRIGVGKVFPIHLFMRDDWMS